MNKKAFVRQTGLINPADINSSIFVVGAGGIGSWTTLCLAKMGCTDITVFDFDKVELRNTPSQFYKVSQIGEYKVGALKNSILEETGIEIKTKVGKFEDLADDELLSGESNIVILAVDSMKARKNIWDKLRTTVNWDFMIDGRMAGELVRMLIVTPYDSTSMIKYDKSVNSNKEVYQEECTSKAVIYNTFICGGLITSIVKKYIKGEEIKNEVTFDIKATQIY